MNPRIIGLFTIAAVLILSAVVPAQPTPLGTGFTYQGQIKQNGIPFTGTCDFKFELYNASSGASGVGQIGTTQTKTTSVSNGLFTVTLDFGIAFHSDMRWLDVQAACPSGVSYVPLSPRQQLTATPYALALPGLHTEVNTTSPNIIGGYAGNTVSAGKYGATISGGGAVGTTAGWPDFNHVYGHFGTIGGGAGNNAGGASWTAIVKDYATIGGGYINSALGDSSTIGGGWENGTSGLMATVAGGGYNFAGGAGSFIGGGGVEIGPGWVGTAGNAARGNGSTIPGGINNNISASGTYATIGGGSTNSVTSKYGTIAGGGPGDDSTSQKSYDTRNSVTGDYGTIGGGGFNTVAGLQGVIGGGISNQASGPRATVGGGYVNVASGNASTVPGGANNLAQGAYSFAAGGAAQATHDGSFVWASAEGTSSWGVQTFTARAHGGVRFYTASGTGTGVQVPSGSGSWGSLSDHAAKDNVSSINGREILARVAALPVTTWNYKTQDAAIRHIGPMAQDFYAAFGVGEDSRFISTIDADGVALAAIQGLYQELKDRDAKIATLESRLTELEQVLKQLAANTAEKR